MGAAAPLHDMGRTSDAELIEASRRGERAAFGELVERYQGVVCAVSYSGTRDRALSEDVAQETFLAAWRQLDQLRETVRLRAWLCGIARNLARKARAKSDREQPVDPPPRVFADGVNPFDIASDAETERVVAEALARVPDTYREVLVLDYHEQRPIKEVADALGISEAAAMQRLSRGRQYLADGVNDLVERALRAARTRRHLAASVLAALPALVPSPVDAATRSHQGWNMLKIALIVAAAAGAGTTAVVVHHSLSKSDEPALASPTAVAEPVETTRGAAPAHVQPRVERQHQTPTTAPRLEANPNEHQGPIELDREKIEKLGLYRGPSRGPAEAPVTIVIFADMKCPYCGKVVGTLDQLLEEYPKQLKLVVRQFPVHDSARLAAEATLAADAQGKFWELYDLVVAHEQDELNEEELLGFAQQGGLDVGKLKDALDHHTFADAVAADTALGNDLGIRGTPTLYFNGKPMVGAQRIEEMRKLINAALASL
jgi:RNA polymerase sigma factor (sigma-70 family)